MKPWIGRLAVVLAVGVASRGIAQAAENPLPVKRNERALIAVVNLSILAKRYQFLYRREESRAATKIRRDLAKEYVRVEIFEKTDATRANLLRAIRDAELDPSIRAIDTIIYTHGRPGEMGFIDTGFYPSSKIRDDILALEAEVGSETGQHPKLRALYSDACFGATHMDDWVRAGFHVASGSIQEDTNWSMDLHRWMKAWRKGETFEFGIHRANRVWITGITDWVISDGNSHKLTAGETDITIETPVE